MPTRRSTRGRHRTRRRLDGLSMAIAVVVLLGTCLALYPAAASWFSAVQQTQHTDAYVEVTDSLSPMIKEDELGKAQDYNRTLANGTRIVDPFSAVKEHTTEDEDIYWDLLDPSDDGLMARLRIPALDISLPVYHGTAEDVLLQGVGHLQGTALPVGGEGTHAVMTGHRGLPQAAMFTELDKLKVGEQIEIDVYGQVLVYQVTSTEVVLPEETAGLRPVADKDLLSLVTCTPLGVNSHRIIVTGERILPTPIDAGAPVASAGFPWWILIAAATFIACTVYVMLTRKTVRSDLSA